MDGDLPALAPSGAMVTGVLTAWPWDAASAMGKVGLWAPQGRRGPAAWGGGGEHGRKKSLNCHPFRAQQAYKAILALESTNGIGGSGWLTLAPYPARMVLTHCLPVSFHSRVKEQRPGCKVNTLLRAFPARAWPGSTLVTTLLLLLASGEERPHPGLPLLGLCVSCPFVVAQFLFSAPPPPFVAGWF